MNRLMMSRRMMTVTNVQTTTVLVCALLLATLTAAATAQYAPPPPPPAGYSAAQAPAPPPPAMSPAQLDQLVARIALYPDPLLAQVMTAATFANEIPEAASWANQHAYLKGDALAGAIQADNLQWDPSVLGLLPFPQVLSMMANDPAWTQQLGDAVLTQHEAVMDAVQHQRVLARNYGYLAPNPYENVVYADGYVQIIPVNPAYLYVPVYDPGIVFFPPRPGFVVSAAIHFGPSVVIGTPFLSFGWWGGGFGWGAHAILIGGHPWGRTWFNRANYVHPYDHPWGRPGGARMENHGRDHDFRR